MRYKILNRNLFQDIEKNIATVFTKNILNIQTISVHCAILYSIKSNWQKQYDILFAEGLQGATSCQDS